MSDDREKRLVQVEKDIGIIYERLYNLSNNFEHERRETNTTLAELSNDVKRVLGQVNEITTEFSGEKVKAQWFTWFVRALIGLLLGGAGTLAGVLIR